MNGQSKMEIEKRATACASSEYYQTKENEVNFTTARKHEETEMDTANLHTNRLRSG